MVEPIGARVLAMRQVQVTALHHRLGCQAASVNRRMSRMLAIIVAATLLSGCIDASSRSVPADYWGGYQPGESYVTKVPLVVMQIDSSLTRKHLALAVPPDVAFPGGRLYASPPTKNLYGPCDPDKPCSWVPEDVVMLVPAGSAITLSRIERHHGWSAWFGKYDEPIVFALMDISKIGRREVDILDLSIRSNKVVEGKNYPVFAPDLTLLSKLRK